MCRRGQVLRPSMSILSMRFAVLMSAQVPRSCITAAQQVVANAITANAPGSKRDERSKLNPFRFAYDKLTIRSRCCCAAGRRPRPAGQGCRRLGGFCSAEPRPRFDCFSPSRSPPNNCACANGPRYQFSASADWPRPPNPHRGDGPSRKYSHRILFAVD